MKKTLLVAALAAGFAGVAHAESSVTLYGIVDAGYGFKTSKFTDFDGSVSKTRDIGARQSVRNGNRWGLKGTEDLGNGTSAIFQLESGFKIANGESAQGGRLFGRKAIIGLTGDSWGTFTIGRQSNAADDFVSGIDPFGTGYNQASAQSLLGGNVSYRADSVIKYVSPNFSGFQFGLGLVHSDHKETLDGKLVEGENNKKSTGFTVGLGYSNGPLTLGAGFDYAKVKNYGYDADGELAANSMKGWSLGAAYDFDVVKLHLMFSQQRDGTFRDTHESAVDGAYMFGTLAANVFPAASEEADDVTVGQFLGKGYRSNAWLVGLSAPVGEAGKVMFSYQGGVAKNKNLDGFKLKGSVFSLGYEHALSKRTAVYAMASYGTLKAKYEGESAKLKSTEVVVGLNHRF